MAITPIVEGDIANRLRRLTSAVLGLSEILHDGGNHGRREEALATIVAEGMEASGERMATIHPCFQRAPSMARRDVGAVEMRQLGVAHRGEKAKRRHSFLMI